LSFASGQFHPAAASTSSVIAALVRGSPSIYHPRLASSRGGGEKVFRFQNRLVALNAFNLNHLGVQVKGRNSKLSPLGQPAAGSGDSPTSYQPYPAPSTPSRILVTAV
ncbi:MAG TPA: hypothetical protein VGC13_20855, partial [Longimicrobium sp.]|uniref:hypothetical protein n=1 Tax=Longimicrobium sp. TaxID=2029185 RepID=UPI002EDB0989